MNDKLSATSREYWERATEILDKSRLLEYLAKYGDVELTGSYAADLMMSGDIDLYVITAETFDLRSFLSAFNDIYTFTAGCFRSYYAKGQWDDPRIGNEQPVGYYMGLKTNLNGEVWKIDIWFVHRSEHSERKKRTLNIESAAITADQRRIILESKHYRKAMRAQISSQRIYEAVIIDRMANWQSIISLVPISSQTARRELGATASDSRKQSCTRTRAETKRRQKPSRQ